MVDKDKIIDKLKEIHKVLIWIMREYRRESGKSKEKFGDFYVEKGISYIGYFKNGEFIVDQIDSEMKSSE